MSFLGKIEFEFMMSIYDDCSLSLSRHRDSNPDSLYNNKKSYHMS